MAVFLPTAFLPGITGQLYRQFALTIAATAVISAINAVTLKPAQCAVYLSTAQGLPSQLVLCRASTAVYDRFRGSAISAIVARMVRHHLRR